MCKNAKIACEKLSADYVANKTKTPFERIYTVVINPNGGPKHNKHNQIGQFKKGVPYIVWATYITKATVTIRDLKSKKSTEVDSCECQFTNISELELNGMKYVERQINGVYHYVSATKAPANKKI